MTVAPAGLALRVRDAAPGAMRRVDQSGVIRGVDRHVRVAVFVRGGPLRVAGGRPARGSGRISALRPVA